MDMFWELSTKKLKPKINKEINYLPADRQGYRVTTLDSYGLVNPITVVYVQLRLGESSTIETTPNNAWL